MNKYYVGFGFSTFIEAESEEEAVKKAEKALAENGYAVHVQKV
jgi:hypothetical protein